MSGARQKDEEWNPEENGGFAIHGAQRLALILICHLTKAADTEGKAGPADPLAALEKTTEAQNHATKVQIPRLEALQGVSDHYNNDPYALSSRVRKRFRAEKKIEAQKRTEDDTLKGKYGLPEELKLVEDDAEAKHQARDEWAKARMEYEAERHSKIPRLSLSSSSGSQSRSTSDVVSSLKARILDNTRRSSNLANRRKPPDRRVLLK